MENLHSALGFILTGWLAFNAGIIAGAWWATRPKVFVP